MKCTNPDEAISDGVAYLPEDRKTQGLILDHSIRDNYALPSLGRLSVGGLVQHRKIDAEAQQYMERLRIKAPSMHTVARQLSGGNQQKAVVAKWLGAQTKVLIFDEPTRGIDINGRREIYRVIEELLEQGVGILMLTSDYAEALEMSHRILVMRRGSIAKEFQRGEPTESDILREAIGEVPAGRGRLMVTLSGSVRWDALRRVIREGSRCDSEIRSNHMEIAGGSMSLHWRSAVAEVELLPRSG